MKRPMYNVVFEALVFVMHYAATKMYNYKHTVRALYMLHWETLFLLSWM